MYSDAELDFEKFTLGQGNSEQKHKKIRAVVENLLEDDTQRRHAKHVLFKIR